MHHVVAMTHAHFKRDEEEKRKKKKEKGKRKKRKKKKKKNWLIARQGRRTLCTVIRPLLELICGKYALQPELAGQSFPECCLINESEFVRLSHLTVPTLYAQ